MRKGLQEPPSSQVSFSGHETFVFRHAWLKKAVDAVAQEPEIFARETAMQVLGVGKNMVRSIRHWGLATRTLEEEPHTRGLRIRTSWLGRFLFGPEGKDPYLEEANSLWLLHWNLATNQRRSTTWSWAFGLLPSDDFTRDRLAAFVRENLERGNFKLPSENSLRRDIDCFIRTYASEPGLQAAVLEDSLDCPLVELGLIQARSDILRFNRGPKQTLADEIFVAALTDFWKGAAPERETLAFSEIAYGFGSPGVVFRLDDNSLIERLDRLDRITNGELEYAETAGLRQVYRRGVGDGRKFLESYYQKSEPLMFVGA